MRRIPWIIGLMVPILIGVRSIAEEGASPSPEVIVLQKCTLEYARSTMVGLNANAQMTVVQECLVRPGDPVQAGQVIGRLFNKDLLAEREVRTANLELCETTIRQREAALEVEKMKFRRAEMLFGRGAMSVEELQLEQLAVRTADLDLQAARQNRREAESQLRQNSAMLASRDMTSPHNGIVLDIYTNTQESTYYTPIPRPLIISSLAPPSISPGSMFVFCKVVDVSRVRAVGYLDMNHTWRVCPGQAVRIIPNLEDGGDLQIAREVFEGEITFVDSEIDPKTRTCRVFAEVENRGGLLRSGLECRLEIDLKKTSDTKGHTREATLGRSVKAEDQGQ